MIFKSWLFFCQKSTSSGTLHPLPSQGHPSPLPSQVNIKLKQPGQNRIASPSKPHQTHIKPMSNPLTIPLKINIFKTSPSCHYSTVQKQITGAHPNHRGTSKSQGQLKNGNIRQSSRKKAYKNQGNP